MNRYARRFYQLGLMDNGAAISAAAETSLTQFLEQIKKSLVASKHGGLKYQDALDELYREKKVSHQHLVTMGTLALAGVDGDDVVAHAKIMADAGLLGNGQLSVIEQSFVPGVHEAEMLTDDTSVAERDKTAQAVRFDAVARRILPSSIGRRLRSRSASGRARFWAEEKEALEEGLLGAGANAVCAGMIEGLVDTDDNADDSQSSGSDDDQDQELDEDQDQELDEDTKLLLGIRAEDGDDDHQERMMEVEKAAKRTTLAMLLDSDSDSDDSDSDDDPFAPRSRVSGAAAASSMAPVAAARRRGRGREAPLRP
jgi:hypothetical protein